jgi:hypothetical protein
MLGLGKKLKTMLDPQALDAIADKSKVLVQKAIGKLPDSLKDNSVIDLLKETSAKLGAILKGIDKVLDTKAKIANISDKTKDLLKWGKTKVKSGVEKAKTLFPDKEEIKSKEEAAKESDQTSTAPPSALKKATGAVGKWLSKKFKGKEVEAPSAALPTAAPIIPKKKGILGKLAGLAVAGLSRLKKPSQEPEPSAPETDTGFKPLKIKKSLSTRSTEAKERFADQMTKLKDKMSLRKKEVDEEREGAKPKAKKDGGSFLTKIISSIVGLGGTVVSGIISGMGFLLKDVILMKGIPLLGRTIMSGIGLLAKAIPGLGGIAGGIAKATQGGVWGAAKGLATGAFRIATSKALWSGVGVAARVAGSVALRAGAMLLTGPVGIAVGVGLAAYAGYKWYKYSKRNDVSNLVKLRLLQYGMDETKKENYYKLIALEDVLLKYMILTPSGGYRFKGLTKDVNDDIMDLFKISEDDEDIADKKAVVGKWLSERFLPVYKMHLDALYNTDNTKKLEDLDNLDKKLVLDYIGKATIPQSVYNVSKMILDKDIVDITITKEEVDDYQAKLVATYKSIQTDKPTDKVPKLPEVKPPAPPPPPAGKDINTKKSNAGVEDIEPPKGDNKNKQDIQANEKDDYKNKYDVQATKTVEDINASKPINKLDGPMVTPTSDLEGIKLVNNLDKQAIYNLDPNVNQLFTSMTAEYKKLTGKDVPVIEGHRSRERQAELYRKYPERAAAPGSSTHEFGLALDIDSATADELDKLGLLRKYGFTRPIGKEKWHLEPIGVSMDPTRAKSSVGGRIAAVEGSPGRGGGGYGTLDSSVLKKRNIPYQVSLFTNATDSAVDNKDLSAKNVLTDKKVPIVTAKTEIPTTVGDVGPIPGMTPNRKRPSASSTPVADVGYIPGMTPNRKRPSKDAAEDISPPVAGKTTTIETKKDTTAVAYNKATDLTTYKNLTAEQAIQKASELTGVSAKTLTRFAEIESSMRTSVKAGTSSATGLFQFTDRTWEYMLKKHGATYNIPSDAKPDNPLYNSILAGQYIKDNLAALGSSYKQAGMDDTTAAYLAHHYGPTGAKKFIDTYIGSPDTKVAEVVSSQAYAANKQELGDNTVKTYVTQVSAKVNKSPVMTAQSTGKTPELQQAVYKPPQGYEGTNTSTPSSGVNTASGASSSSTTGIGLQTALYRPSTPTIPPSDKSKPDVKTTPYTYTPPTAVKPVKSETALNNTASTTTIDLGELESIASKQLNVLENIRDLITSIAKTPPAGVPNTPTPSRPTGDNKRMLSNEKVDVSRKTYT